MRFFLLAALLRVAMAAGMIEDYFYSPCSTAVFANSAVSSLVADIDPEDYVAMYSFFCKNKEITITLFGCMQDARDLSTAMGYGSGERKFKSSYRTLTDYCDLYYFTDAAYNFNEAKEAWNAAPKPFANYTYANETGTLPFTVPTELLSPTIPYYQDSGDSSYDTHQYSYWTLYYVVICIGLATIFNFLTWLMPKGAALAANNPLGRVVRRFITMPPMWNERLARWTHFHSSRLPAFEIFGYFVMNTIFLSVNYRYKGPVVYESRSQAIGYMLGYRSGIMPMFKLPYLFFFAGRNNFMIWMTGWDYAVFSMWHRWLARLATIDVLIHWAAYSVGLQGGAIKYLPEEWTEWYWIAGVIATFIMVIMAVQGSVWLRRAAYEIFLYTHIFWAIGFIVFTWYHVLWYAYPMSPIYVCIAVWCYDRIARLVRMAMSGVCNASITMGADNVLVIDIKDKNPVRAFPGSHVFVYFMTPRCFHQSHPFTAIKTDTGLRLYMKSWNGMTKRIKQMVLDNDGHLDMKVLVEGPYGIALNLKSFDEVVCVAGGIGITSIYSHLAERIFSGDVSQKVTLHWVVRHEEFFSTFSEDIKKFSNAGIKVILHVTGHGAEIASLENSLSSPSESDKEKPLEKVSSQAYEIMEGRPDMLELVPKIVSEATGSMAFLTCGPPSLNRDVRAAVSSSLHKTKYYLQCYDEGFEM